MININNLLVKSEDEPEEMNWFKTMEMFDNNPDSEYRLPTRLELLAMYENREKIGGIGGGIYWSSSEDNPNNAWIQRFDDGYQDYNRKYYTRLVRLVKKNSNFTCEAHHIDNTENVLTEREKTHGKFASNAKISQELYYTLMSGDGAGDLTDVQAEALKAICQKIARIVNGDASFEDHWVDIQGYCQLALEGAKDETSLT